MDIERLHPQLREAAAAAPAMRLESRAMRAIARFATRHAMPRTKAPGVSARYRHENGLVFREYRPADPSGAALLWIHGGGMVIGGPLQDEALCAETASALGVTVYSATYREAPEHPYPAPQDDVHALWLWLMANAERERIDAARIAVGGASAGSGLAAALVNRIRDARGPQPAAQWLLYPMLDDRTAADRELDADHNFIWNNTDNRFGWSSLLRGTAAPGDPHVPADAAPARRADLTGLPPTWIGVGSADLFHVEDAEYARRLGRAGVPVQFDVLEGAPHGFESLMHDAPIVIDFVAGARAWLASALAA
jgi:acetyl esterase/lipase